MGRLLVIQVFNGLVNGAFYALLSLGLAVIFGMLRIVNFAHGAMYMLGAFTAYSLGERFGLGFWPSLLIAPVLIGLFGVLLERTLLRRLYNVRPAYNLLLTFGLTLVIQDGVRLMFGISGAPYSGPPQLAGVTNLGFVVFPTYRLFVICFSVAVCAVTYYLIERTRPRSGGACLHGKPHRHPHLRRRRVAVGHRRLRLRHRAGGAGGRARRPHLQRRPAHGLRAHHHHLRGGGDWGHGKHSRLRRHRLHRRHSAVAVGSALYPPIANTLVFILMAGVLLVRPTGLFGLPEGGR